MITRRTLCGCALALVCPRGAFPATAEMPGCAFFETDPNSQTSRGDLPGLKAMDLSQNFENGLVIVLSELRKLLQVQVAFGYYDDDIAYPNARALEHTSLSGLGAVSPIDGAVILGRHLIEQIRKKEQGTRNFGAALTAVCAHEFGHILQFKYIIPQLMQIEEPVTTRAELHADFVSGYFAAFRKRQQPEYPAVMQAMTQFRYGDGAYKPIDHGSPEQRGAAVYAGYQLGQAEPLNPEQVTLRGLEYVTRLAL